MDSQKTLAELVKTLRTIKTEKIGHAAIQTGIPYRKYKSIESGNPETLL